MKETCRIDALSWEASTPADVRAGLPAAELPACLLRSDVITPVLTAMGALMTERPALASRAPPNLSSTPQAY